jgi:hypothetical protein
MTNLLPLLALALLASCGSPAEKPEGDAVAQAATFRPLASIGAP